MRTSATIHQHKHPTNDSGRMWKGRKLDAGGTQVGRSADAKQTQRDGRIAEAPISIDAGGTQTEASITH